MVFSKSAIAEKASIVIDIFGIPINDFSRLLVRTLKELITMKAGVLHYNVKSERIGDLKKAMDQSLNELHKEIAGFHAGFLFVSSNTGKCFSVGIYDTLENAKVLMSSASYQKFLSEIREYVTVEPTRDVCDVSGDLELVTRGKKAA